MQDRLWSLRGPDCGHLLAWILAATVLLALSASAPEATAQGASDRFNLRCEITILGSDRTTHEVRVFAVDLTDRRWSRVEPGAEVNQIKEITDSKIVLSDLASADGRSRLLGEVERYSGKFHGLVRSPPAEGEVEADDCAQQPFTGFPQKKL